MDDKKDLSHFWNVQKSLSEWFEDIGHADTEAIRHEDNDKRERLAVLNRIIGLPFDRPVQFTGKALARPTPALKTYLREHDHELCALRLIPLKEKLPKLRMRGKTVLEAYEWFKTLDINPADYRADFVGQGREARWATIFIVNEHGMHGEVIYGGHYQLTQGLHESTAPNVFHYDFKDWTMAPADKAALAHVQKLASLLHVADASKRAAITEQLGGSFTHNYLEGYFETTDSTDFGIWFIDYNQTLARLHGSPIIHTGTASGALVSGQTGCGGIATGPVRIATPDHLDIDVPDNFVLVCKVTTPQYVPLMQRASAIVTDQGGILSHAAIVARELKKPCIVATGNATTVLKENQLVTVDADQGTVRPA